MIIFDELDARHVVLLLLLVAAFMFAALAVAGIWFHKIASGRCLRTVSGLCGLASAWQLKMSGWFDRAWATYDDEKKYPLGPPSELVRQAIEHPDFPIQSAIRYFIFFDADMGALLATTGIVAAMIAAWI